MALLLLRHGAPLEQDAASIAKEPFTATIDPTAFEAAAGISLAELSSRPAAAWAREAPLHALRRPGLLKDAPLLLHTAAAHGHLELAKTLLQMRANVNATTEVCAVC